jgi:hypothetical protein
MRKVGMVEQSCSPHGGQEEPKKGPEQDTAPNNMPRIIYFLLLDFTPKSFHHLPIMLQTSNLSVGIIH